MFRLSPPFSSARVAARGRSVDARDGRDDFALLLVQSVVVHRPVVDRGLSRLLVEVGHGVLHPVHVVPVRGVFPRVGAPRLGAEIGRVHRGRRVGQQIAQLEGLDQVRVPDEGAVRHLHVLELSHRRVDLHRTLGEHVGGAVDGGVVLHHLLHLEPQLRRLHLPVREANRVQLRNRLGARILGEGRDGVARLVEVGDAEGAGAAEDDDVEQRVGAESVGAVHRGTAHLPRREEAWHHLVVLDHRARFRVALLLHHLAEMVGGYPAHVVVHGGQHGDGLLGHVHAGEDGRRLTDARQPLRQQLVRQVVQVKVDVVFVWADAASLADLHGHGP
mmetsp:Transcript_28961/g.64766  ORF Transcript_28961/g.64766 Transcript_28961/m.64766 type:complete len:331 (-) Transcript_28961:957-1949(-)